MEHLNYQEVSTPSLSDHISYHLTNPPPFFSTTGVSVLHIIIIIFVSRQDPRRPPSLHQRRATATVLMPRYSKPLMIPQVERNDDVNNNMKGHSGSK